MAELSQTSIEQIKSFREFLNRIEADELVNDPELTLYRGQADAKWNLEPSIARNGVSKKFQAYQESEAKFVEEFRRLGRSKISTDILANDWDLLAYAQHNGLKTRLLDWTTNPLIALWFAFEKELFDVTKVNRSVWILYLNKEDVSNTNVSSPWEQERTLAFKPNHVNARITAQNGWFTTHKYFKSAGRFTPLNKQKQYVNKLYRIDIPNNFREHILVSLDKFGVNAASVYPDVYGMTQYLNWKMKTF